MDNKNLEDKIDRIELKIDAMMDKLVEQKLVTTKQALILQNQNEQLEIHIRRSDNLENYVQLLEDKFEEDLKPLNRHILVVDTVMKVFGAACVIIGAVVGILQVLKII